MGAYIGSTTEGMGQASKGCPQLSHTVFEIVECSQVGVGVVSERDGFSFHGP